MLCANWFVCSRENKELNICGTKHPIKLGNSARYSTEEEVHSCYNNRWVNQDYHVYEYGWELMAASNPEGGVYTGFLMVTVEKEE